jgi:hypothetical protein
MGWGSSLEQMAVMIVSMLMHRPEKSVKFCMDPMQVMAVFLFVFWKSAKSITFSDVAFISLINLWSIRHLFLWGRKKGWLKGICFKFEAGDLLCSEIPLKDLRSKGLRDDFYRD